MYILLKKSDDDDRDDENSGTVLYYDEDRENLEKYITHCKNRREYVNDEWAKTVKEYKNSLAETIEKNLKLVDFNFTWDDGQEFTEEYKKKAIQKEVDKVIRNIDDNIRWSYGRGSEASWKISPFKRIDFIQPPQRLSSFCEDPLDLEIIHVDSVPDYILKGE